jgi:hypothetical protein
VGKNLVVFVFLFAPLCAVADYHVTGKIEGSVCSGFVIQSCSFKRVDAVKDSDGIMRYLTESFKSVTEYNKSKGRCWIKTKNTGGGFVSLGINALTQPDFYEKTPSGLSKIDVEYITFPCVER